MILLAAASHLILNVTPDAQFVIHIQNLDYGYSTLNEPSKELSKTRGRLWQGAKQP